MANTLYIWSDLENYNIDQVKLKVSKLDKRFENLKNTERFFKLFL